jgi:ElaA protein
MIFSATNIHNISAGRLLEILRLRTEVFVVEQHCAYPEIDDADYHATHLALTDDQGILVGAGRIIFENSSCRIGRVVIDKHYRSQGFARQLMEHAIHHIKTYHPQIKQINISAQTHLAGFYGQLGFTSINVWYLEDLIPHVDMEMIL